MSNWKQDFQTTINSYVFECVLPGSKEVIKFKPVDVATMKKLLIYESSNDFDTVEFILDDLIKNSVLEPATLNIDDMYIYDRLYLLFQIRMKSKGESIQSNYSCPKCKNQSIQSIALSDFPFNEYKEPKNFVIPALQDVSLEVCHMKRSHQKEAAAKLKEDKDLSDNQRQYLSMLYTMAAAISAYIGKDFKDNTLTLDDKLFILDRLPDSILTNIKNWHEDNRFGYDIVFEYKCPHCKHSEKREFDFEATI